MHAQDPFIPEPLTAKWHSSAQYGPGLFPQGLQGARSVNPIWEPGRSCEPGATGCWMWWEDSANGCGRIRKRWHRWLPTPTWSPPLLQLAHYSHASPPICSTLQLQHANAGLQLLLCFLFEAFLPPPKTPASQSTPNRERSSLRF